MNGRPAADNSSGVLMMGEKRVVTPLLAASSRSLYFWAETTSADLKGDHGLRRATGPGR